MTVLEKLERVLQGKGGVWNYAWGDSKNILNIVYSPISKDLVLHLEDKSERNTAIDSYDFKNIVLSDDFTTTIKRDGSKKYPEQFKNGQWIRYKTRYSEYRDGYSSSHEDAEPSESEIINNTHHCIYCGKTMFSIQERLKEKYTRRFGYVKHDHDYDITGYTCICLDSELKKELDYKIGELKKEYNKKQMDIINLYNLKKNEKILLKTKIKYLEKEIERL